MDLFYTYAIPFVSAVIGGGIVALITYNLNQKSIKIKQTSKIADLFAFWLTCDDDTLKTFTKDQRVAHCEKLNRLVWELVVWIPNEGIVKDIMERLSHKSEKEVKELLLNAREQIQGKKSKILNWKDIVDFK